MRDGRPWVAIGTPGGHMITQTVAQMIMNMIDFGLSPQQAGDQPRVSHAGSSSPWGAKSTAAGQLKFEHGMDPQVKLALAQMGHGVLPGVGAHGGYQAIWRLERPLRYFGGSDPRKDGVAVGY